ncbi:MAG: hypothetical protein ACO3VN_08030, partial [Ilumatobacteraceae bacterium]
PKARELKEDDTKRAKKQEKSDKTDEFTSKRVTPPKNKPTTQITPPTPGAKSPPKRPKPPQR